MKILNYIIHLINKLAEDFRNSNNLPVQQLSTSYNPNTVLDDPLDFNGNLCITNANKAHRLQSPNQRNNMFRIILSLPSRRHNILLPSIIFLYFYWKLYHHLLSHHPASQSSLRIRKKRQRGHYAHLARRVLLGHNSFRCFIRYSKLRDI